MIPSCRFLNLGVGRPHGWRRTRPVWMHLHAWFCVPLLVAACSAQSKMELRNNYITAEFDSRGLVSVRGPRLNEVVHLADDEFSISIDGDRLDSAKLEPAVKPGQANTVTYAYAFRGYEVNVIYELRPGWHFVTKQLQVVQAPRSAYVVHLVEPARVAVDETISALFTPGTYLPQLGHPEESRKSLSTQNFGAFLRLSHTDGLMLLAQNPFLEISREGQTVSLSYKPEMEWQSSWGPFSSDLTCIGPYKIIGHRIPSQMVLEWEVPPASISSDGADEGEIQAFTECVEAFLLHPSPKPITVEVGWTLNDYQINVATPEGRAEYKRIVDISADLGMQSLVYAPANNELAQIKDDTDDWHWEHVLWLGLGQKIREGKWDPETSPLPASITEMLDYAKSKQIGLLAYVYPSLPFSQNHAWLVIDPNKPANNTYATLASRQFQDFLIQQLMAFKRRTGIAGYSFDYTFLQLPGSSSYAQWWGWRRVLEALRTDDPEIIIDGRQTYQMYGAWSWLAGSYPHPTGQDEQAESFTPYPDLHFDRVSADRTRFVNYWYRNYQFAPAEVIPGYMTHQTERNINIPSDALSHDRPQHVEQVYTDNRDPDWDYLGYRYSVISSIATGGWNNVMSMIPARNSQEFQHFSSEDKAWIRHWLGWTEQNAELLRHTRTILGQPAIGKTDGTSAVLADRGYLFLFNPNYAQKTADLRLDASVGLTTGNSFLLREIYPRQSTMIAKPGAGPWSYGDKVSFPLQGTSATVLEIVPFNESTRTPLVFGSADPDAGALIDSGVLRADHISGEPGSEQEIGVLLGDHKAIAHVFMNGKEVRFEQNVAYLSAHIKFAGTKFVHSEQIKLTTSPNEVLRGTFVVPRRILNQLSERRKQWPISWTPRDYESTWLVPERLLLFLQIAEPGKIEDPVIELDGRPLTLKRAYSSVRVSPPCFVGFYADLSNIKPDVQHRVELKLPALKEGQAFQGLFFDNVEAEYTGAIAQ